MKHGLRSVVWGGIALLCVFAIPVDASQTSFPISAQYGEDTSDPSTPSPVSVTPVSANQIDITWGTSTDNFVVAGYRVYRDNALLTSQTSIGYSDTGLSASTSYSYYVTAFDAAGNTSASSTVVSTTTLAAPAPPPPATTTKSTTQTGSFIPEPSIVQLTVDPSDRGTKVEFNTDTYTQYTLRFGKDDALSGGLVETQIFKKQHTTILNQLQPQTTYEYEIYLTDRFGRNVLAYRDTFTTLPDIAVDAVQNVHSLQTEVVGDDVILRWQNPNIEDFAYTRIVRNPYFYPQDTLDGQVVYDGINTSYIDTAALANRSPQYYTVFVYNLSGRFSSGATTRVDTTGVVTAPIPPVATSSQATDTASTTPDTTVPFSLHITDVEIVQHGELQTLQDNTYTLSAGTPFLVRLSQSVLPSFAKRTIVSFAPQQRATRYHFQLQENTDSPYLEAHIPDLEMGTSSQIQVEVYDANLRVQAAATGTILFTTSSTPQLTENLWQVGGLYILMVGLIVMFSIWLLYRLVWTIFWRQRS